ncbi:hypothetical protein R5R35_014249 [Gryllus longicercus]|uniref:Uncharacterized protein n=1 Tax=Gryllus longicercus TaxID=2509291 RepID=A0AAN9WIG5_9ORTH
MDEIYPACAMTSSMNMDENSSYNVFADKSPILIATDSLTNVDNLHSDSEDDLPSYGFNWTPNLKEAQKVEFNVEEARAKRRKDEEFFARMDKLDDLLKKDEPKVSTTTTFGIKDVKSEDEDVQFILRKAKEMKVEEFTVKNASRYEIINLEQSLKIFNHKTLTLGNFLQKCSLERKPKLVSSAFDDVNRSVFDPSLWSPEDREGICFFLFLIMSVHPKYDAVNFCYRTLINESRFSPCFTDFINVFRNWGYDLQVLYKTVPDIYTGLLSCFEDKRPEVNGEVKEHNMSFIFLYLTSIVRRQPPDTFLYLIEPLLRLYFDMKIYSSSLQLSIIDITIFLTGVSHAPKELMSRRVSVKDVHIKNLSLIQQTEICTQIFYRTCFGFPLGFAILQQFLGCPKITYCLEVNLKAVSTLLSEKRNIIETSTFLEIFCYLEIVSMFLFHCDLVTFKDHTQQINYNTWHDLLHDWLLRISHKELVTDPILLKEKISKLKYQLRMKQAIQMRHHRDISLQMSGDNL